MNEPRPVTLVSQLPACLTFLACLAVLGGLALLATS